MEIVETQVTSLLYTIAAVVLCGSAGGAYVGVSYVRIGPRIFIVRDLARNSTITKSFLLGRGLIDLRLERSSVARAYLGCVGQRLKNYRKCDDNIRKLQYTLTRV
jgi:hypothetical protein